ncbi:glycosyltransferase family 4 protein [Desulfovibrio mangrovi]|uniref:glycosyltransferase family 4 protein n=1 Tax=Desulfovibrio mangrovi TaxID=2976983 RepID=UPI002246CC24|nr:glycosyltransferase family 4 protein [Desulfovibrio mangrovi]UZP68713.1 glycosyltransferase family 4 protein [Desulfovibrio mangrovi]
MQQTTRPPVALFIKTFSRYGGVEQFCYRFNEFLISRGYPVTVFCGEDKTDEAAAGKPRTEVVEVGMWRPGRFLKHFSLFHKMKSRLAQLPKGTVSFCFGNFAGCTIYRSGGPHLDFLARSMRAQRNPLRKLSKLIVRFFSPINWLMPMLDLSVYPHPDTRCILAISNKVRQAVETHFPGTHGKIAVIPNGVNTARFNPDKFNELRHDARIWYSLHEGQKAIGFCSTNFELKGLDRLIKALTLLPPEYMLIAAGGRNHTKYIEYARSLDVHERIIFPGKVDDMPQFYAALDVFCHPSFYDTFGSVVAEALAMGVPTVTTEDVGACDLIKNGENGIVVNDPTPEELSQAILNLQQVPAGQPFNCVQDDAEVFERYLALIERAAHNRKTASAEQQG